VTVLFVWCLYKVLDRPPPLAGQINAPGDQSGDNQNQQNAKARHFIRRFVLRADQIDHVTVGVNSPVAGFQPKTLNRIQSAKMTSKYRGETNS